MKVSTKDGVTEIAESTPQYPYLNPSDIKVSLLDFSKVNKFFTIQMNDGEEYYVDPRYIGSIKIGSKLLLISPEAETLFQYDWKMGYEVPVFKGEGVPHSIVALDRKTIDKAATGEYIGLTQFVKDSLSDRMARLRIMQIIKRLHTERNTTNLMPHAAKQTQIGFKFYD